MKYYKHLDRYSHLNIAGTKRVISEKEVAAYTPKVASESIRDGARRVGARMNIRILKVTRVGGPFGN